MKKWLTMLSFGVLWVNGSRAQNGPAASGIVETRCGESRLLAYLSESEGTKLLRAYGYTLDERWVCTEVHSSLTEATMLRFKDVTSREGTPAFTVLEIPATRQVWVIPTSSGMLEAPALIEDPHNIAAFNLVLETVRSGPTNDEAWLEIGRLYMTILGMSGAFPIGRPADPGECDECTVSFSDRPMKSNQPYTEYVLDFSRSARDGRLQLINTSRELVSPTGR